MTVGVRQYEMQVPYGVVEMDGVKIKQLNEKPTLSFFVNAGVYLIEPTVYDYIDKHNKFDMTDLIERLLNKKQTVVSFPISEFWLDIGHLKDYERACSSVKENNKKSKD